jgi:ATP-dependent 26S proteasome regulatory subunit
MTQAFPAGTELKTDPIADEEPFEGSLHHLLAGIAYIDLRVRWAVARARAQGLDPDDEFRGLYISESQIDQLLGFELGRSLWPHSNGQNAGLENWPLFISQARARWSARTAISKEAGQTLLLDRMIQSFGLIPAEVDVLLIALAPEIDPRYERLYAYLQDDVTKKQPSVDLVLNLLTDSFAEKLQLRRLLSDEGSLIKSQLLKRYNDSSSREPTLLGQSIRPAARVVQHLLGNAGFDSRLDGSAELQIATTADPYPRLSGTLINQLQHSIESEIGLGVLPIIAFQGGLGVGKQIAAQYMAQLLDRPLICVDLTALMASSVGLEEGIRLAIRDTHLLDAVLYLSGWEAVLEDGQPPIRIYKQLLANQGLVIIASQVIWQPSGDGRSRRILRVSFNSSDYARRLKIWRHYLEEDDLPLEQLANQFQFAPGQIEDVVASARDLAQSHNEQLQLDDLFVASRAHSNQKLASLATKINPRYRWDDIVLPEDTLALLREMVNTVWQRPVVYEEWGFGQKLALGKGLNALFAGESGTGKTMAADIMAGDLGQDLYKIDLSMLVSKYIGETEKNLNRVFSEAATSNAILFFDEADAIFGKRSEVKDSHDRYANIEISYLLQRMEAYDGVVILATNMRGNLDEAFTRRLHFIVEFPFPEAADREIIWQVNFPAETPIAKDVDFSLLARRFRLAGGNIRNIILASAFLASEKDEVVDMKHLLHASRREYQKIGRLIDDTLFEVNAPQ